MKLNSNSVEEVFFSTEKFALMLAGQAEGLGRALEQNFQHHMIRGPEDLYSGLSLEIIFNGLLNSLATGNFWCGLIVAAAMLWAAIHGLTMILIDIPHFPLGDKDKFITAYADMLVDKL